MRKAIDFSKIPDQEKAKILQQNARNKRRKVLEEKELQEELALTYRYFRFCEKDTRVSISFGYKKVVDNKIRYTVALQSKRDCFSRKKARQIINKRWENGSVVQFPIPFNTKDIATLIAVHWNSRITHTSSYHLLSIPKYLNSVPIYFS